MIPAVATKFRGGGDPYFADVSLLLHGNGTNGGTLFPDSSSHAFSVTPTNAVTSTAESIFNGSSMLFHGADYLTIASATALNLDGAIDWTIEYWVNPIVITSNYSGFVTKRQPGGNDGWSVLTDSTAHLTYYANGSVFSGGGTAVGTGGWHFIAFSRKSGTLYMYLDGILINNGGISDILTNTYDMIIGAGRQDLYFYDGYMAEVRITKGVGRYSGSTCPVPTAPFPNF